MYRSVSFANTALCILPLEMCRLSSWSYVRRHDNTHGTGRCSLTQHHLPQRFSQEFGLPVPSCGHASFPTLPRRPRSIFVLDAPNTTCTYHLWLGRKTCGGISGTTNHPVWDRRCIFCCRDVYCCTARIPHRYTGTQKVVLL